MILGYHLPLNTTILHLGNFSDGNMQGKAAGKISITSRWHQADPPTVDEWKQIVAGIYLMKKLPRNDTVESAHKWLRVD